MFNNTSLLKLVILVILLHKAEKFISLVNILKCNLFSSCFLISLQFIFKYFLIDTIIIIIDVLYILLCSLYC